MTAHLLPDELLAAVDGVLPRERAEHVAACTACRDELATLRSTLETVQRTDVPEPSPLFWDHLSDRVHAAVSTEAVPGTSPAWRRAWRPVIALGAVAAIATLIVSLRTPPVTTANDVAVPAHGNAQSAPLTDDGVWDTMEQMTSALSADDVQIVVAAALEFAPMVSALSASERAAFVTLLGSELSGEGR